MPLPHAPMCNDPRACFGKKEYRDQKRCRILTETYPEGVECPFCKSAAEANYFEEVRLAIEESGLMKKDIAEHLGISPSRFTRILTENMSENTRNRIMEAINQMKGEK